MTDRLIRLTTALAVVAVASVAAIISYQHRLRSRPDARGVGPDGPAPAVHGGRADLGGVHGGTGREPPEPACTTAALWSLGAGIVATAGANLAHGLSRGPIGSRSNCALG